MSAVNACFAVTDRIYQLIKKPGGDRDEFVACIDQLLDQRQALLTEIHPPFTPEEQQLGQEMIRRNAVIDAYFKKIKEDIQKDMQGLSKKKESVDKYVNPYASVGTGSMFYDKKN
jgi:flagellar protein FliT